MNDCKTVKPLLDLMVDDDLGSEEKAMAEEHLRTCPTCRAELELLQSITRTAAALPHDLSPSRDLWEGIETRLEARRPIRRWMNPLVLAAAAMVFAAIGLGVLLAPSRTTAPPTGGFPSSEGVVHAQSERLPSRGFRFEYEQARNDLEAVIESRRDRLDPETLEVIERNMNVIDQAIIDIEQALDSNPGETQLDRQLMLAYQQQIKVLKWAVRLSA